MEGNPNIIGFFSTTVAISIKCEDYLQGLGPESQKDKQTF